MSNILSKYLYALALSKLSLIFLFKQAVLQRQDMILALFMSILLKMVSFVKMISLRRSWLIVLIRLVFARCSLGVRLVFAWCSLGVRLVSNNTKQHNNQFFYFSKWIRTNSS